MPDAKGRREGQPVRARTRTKSDTPSPELDDVYHEEGHAPSSAGYHPETDAEAPAEDAYRSPEKVVDAPEPRAYGPYLTRALCPAATRRQPARARRASLRAPQRVRAGVGPREHRRIWRWSTRAGSESYSQRRPLVRLCQITEYRPENRGVRELLDGAGNGVSAACRSNAAGP